MCLYVSARAHEFAGACVAISSRLHPPKLEGSDVLALAKTVTRAHL